MIDYLFFIITIDMRLRQAVYLSHKGLITRLTFCKTSNKSFINTIVSQIYKLIISDLIIDINAVGFS